jgi:hypothetical protein
LNSSLRTNRRILSGVNFVKLEHPKIKIAGSYSDPRLYPPMPCMKQRTPCRALLSIGYQLYPRCHCCGTRPLCLQIEVMKFRSSFCNLFCACSCASVDELVIILRSLLSSRSSSLPRRCSTMTNCVQGILFHLTAASLCDLAGIIGLHMQLPSLQGHGPIREGSLASVVGSAYNCCNTEGLGSSVTGTDGRETSLDPLMGPISGGKESMMD